MHAVLEEIFDLPAAERTLQQAQSMLPAAWDRVLAEEPGVAELFTGDGTEFREWMTGAEGLLANYFTLEDPTRFDPESREQLVEVVVDGLRLRGYVDRLDISPAGDLRVIDYKTGAAPREASSKPRPCSS